MTTLWQDVRYAARALARSPGFALVLVLTLALGIGANTAIFSLVNGVLLRPLPYRAGEELFRLRQEAPLLEVEDAGVSVRELADYRARGRTLADLVEYHSLWFNLLDRGEPERVQAGVVSRDFFEVMGVKPILGRTFLPEEDRVGAPHVLVLGHDFWLSHFGGDPGVIGRTVEMNDHVHTIVGVLPPLPRYPDDNHVWMPWYACPFRGGEAWTENRELRALTVLGRVRPGVEPAEAQRDVGRVLREMAAEHPEAYPPSAGLRASLLPLEEELTRDARPTFLILLGMAGFVLLIACANVANLTLARLSRREAELAVRAAVGAGRGRLARQLLTESTLVALLGGALGLLLAVGLLDVLADFSARFTPRAAEVEIDRPVLLFTLAVALATGLAVGSFPALFYGRDVTSALREGSGRASAGAKRMRTRRVLVAAQLAVTFMLLIGAGLMARSFVALQRVDPGFDPEQVLTAQVDLDWATYTDPERRRDFFQRLLERLGAAPGVEEAALANNFPLNGGVFSNTLRVEGEPEPAPDAVVPLSDVGVVSPGFFAALRIPVLQGRDFSSLDHQAAPGVAIVSHSLARHRFPGQSPLGKRVSFDGERWLTVVGVVGDVRQEGLDRPVEDQVYVAFAQSPLLSARVVLRSRVAPERLAREVVAAARAVDARQPVAFVRTLEEVRRESVASPRLTTVLLGLFAVVALGISVVGILGLVAYSVSQRTHEIGVRMALGAMQREVVWMVVRDGAGAVGVGLVVGALGALALSRVMAGLLFGVAPTDPPTFLGVSVILLTVALAAAYLPARRATEISPMVALRSD